MAARRNKILSIVFLSWCFLLNMAVGQEGYKYIIQADQIKKIQIFDSTQNNRYDIPTFKKTGGGFLLEISDISETYIVTNSSNGIKMKLYSISNNTQTDWFEIGKDELISIENCFEKYQEKTEWTTGGIVERIVSFFNLGRNGLVLEGENAVLKASSKWISLSVPGMPEFISPNSMFFKWETTHPIQEIKVVDVKSNKTILIDKNPTYQVFTNTKPAKKKKFKKGRFYKITFTPKDSEGDYGPKSIIVYFYSKKEVKKINSFINK